MSDFASSRHLKNMRLSSRVLQLLKICQFSFLCKLQIIRPWPLEEVRACGACDLDVVVITTDYACVRLSASRTCVTQRWYESWECVRSLGSFSSHLINNILSTTPKTHRDVAHWLRFSFRSTDELVNSVL